MKTWHFFDQAGQFNGRSFSGPEEHLAANTPEGCEAVSSDTFTPQAVETGVMFSAAERRRLHAQALIEGLEAKQPRALRELALGYDGAKERLDAIDAQIAALRADLA